MLTLFDAALPSVIDTAADLLPYIVIGLLVAGAAAGAIVLIVLFSKKSRK